MNIAVYTGDVAFWSTKAAELQKAVDHAGSCLTNWTVHFSAEKCASILLENASVQLFRLKI